MVIIQSTIARKWTYIIVNDSSGIVTYDKYIPKCRNWHKDSKQFNSTVCL